MSINGASVAPAQQTRAPANLFLLVGITASGTTILSHILEICHLDQIHKHRKLGDIECPSSLFLKKVKGAKYLLIIDCWFTDNRVQNACIARGLGTSIAVHGHL
jgi:hypothetical protein